MNITYADKVDGESQVTAGDLNEIKTVVNSKSRTQLMFDASGVSGGTTIDWSATGHVLSDFDCVEVVLLMGGHSLLVGTTSVTLDASECLSRAEAFLQWVSVYGTGIQRTVSTLTSVTETGATFTTNNSTYTTALVGIYGIKY